MKEDKTMEFIWKGIGFGANQGILTHVLDDRYMVPGFLDIDEPYTGERCFDMPIHPQDFQRW